MHLPNSPTRLFSAFTFIVFLFLDLLDALLCIIYRYLDHYLEGKPPHCYCLQRTDQVNNELSETLFGRTNVFRLANLDENSHKTCSGGTTELKKNRWSDCGCHSCNAWINNLDMKLHVVVREPSQATGNDRIENVIFLHGFISSSSIWTESVFPNVSESVKAKYRLIAVDLFGFGNSPKPKDSLYTLREHSDMIVKSVVSPLGLKSFHLVAHSMGCTIALAVAANYPKSVKSITLVAPPYLPSSKDKVSFNILNYLAAKKLWPPLSFATSFMSWYEHLGRCVCFVICRNHRLWEKILKLLTGKGDLHYMIMDLTKHTHHSAWHSMHNVLCGGAKYVDDYLDILMENGVKISVFQGEKDEVIPLECSINIKMKVVDAEVCIIPNAGHSTVILGREKEFTKSLEPIWAAAADTNTM